MEDYSINISVKKIIYPQWLGKNCQFVNFHFSHYKSMETLSCHSNQSSYPIKIKNITFIEGNVLSKYAKIWLHPPSGFWEMVFKHFYKNWPFLPPRQPIKYTDLDKSYMKHRWLLNKHFCKKKSKYLHWDRKKMKISTFPIISLWEL